MADRIFHEPPEYFLFKQIPALVDPLPGLQPLKPDGTGRHNDSLQFPVYGCLLAMPPDHIHSNIQPYSLITDKKTPSLYKTQGVQFNQW